MAFWNGFPLLPGAFLCTKAGRQISDSQPWGSGIPEGSLFRGGLGGRGGWSYAATTTGLTGAAPATALARILAGARHGVALLLLLSRSATPAALASTQAGGAFTSFDDNPWAHSFIETWGKNRNNIFKLLIWKIYASKVPPGV